MTMRSYATSYKLDSWWAPSRPSAGYSSGQPRAAVSCGHQYLELLRPGEHTQAHRHTSSAAFHEHVNTGNQPAILFSHTDVPVLRSLDFYREEAHPAGRQ